MDEKIVIRNIFFIGPGKEPASIPFQKGLNVICGASDTGKSFLVEIIDYLLGGGELRDIPERVGYDRARVGLEISDDDFWTFERSVAGGNYKLYRGLIKDELVVESEGIIKAKHAAGKEDNLSGWLLSQINLLNKYIRTNKAGKTRTLSFRDIARLVIVDEEEMIQKSSPFLTEQHTTKTVEYAALKFILTGEDDSAIVAVEVDEKRATGIVAKVELLDQWIYDSQQEIADLDFEEVELSEQLQKLEDSIAVQRGHLTNFQSKIDDQFNHRRAVIEEREKIKDRVSEIQDLLERFDLLLVNYHVDVERLDAIRESGTLFVHQEVSGCPMCGALPSKEHIDPSCDGNVDGNVDGIVKAASAEIGKIKKLIFDLKETISTLAEEQNQLENQLLKVDEKFNNVQNIIQKSLSPELVVNQNLFFELSNKKADVIKTISVFERLNNFIQQRNDFLHGEQDDDEQSEQIKTAIPKYVLNEFSAVVQHILEAWDFPGVGNVYFDETAKDFVINGKPRGSRGKGLRAITHAALTLGLLEYCQKNSLPHPGFIVIDSPLLAYYEPESDDDSLEGSELKTKFYKYLLEEHSHNQIIIVENQHPPLSFEGQISLTVFTKNPQEGRFGLFPNVG